MKLFEIDDRLEQVLLAGTNRETGEIGDECLVELDALGLEKDAKCLALAAYIKGELAEAKAIKDESAKLRDRAGVHTNRADRLQVYLAGHFGEGSDKISDARSVIAWRKNPPSVVIEEEDTLPDYCFRVVPEQRQPDKREMLKRLKGGESLSGASLVQTSRLVIT